MAAQDQHVECTYTFPFPQELVWHFVRDFFGLTRIFPELVTQCTLHEGDTEAKVGSTRLIKYSDGSVFHEKLAVRDDDKYFLKYGATESSPTQVGTNYTATYFVGPISKTNHSFVRYQGTFNGTPEDANNARVFCELVMQAFEDRLETAVEENETPPKLEASELKDDEVGPRLAKKGAVIPYPIEKVWAVATRFSALAKLAPDVFKSSECANGKPDTEVGTLRKLELANDAVILEELTQIDAMSHTFEYIHTDDSPLRFDGYTSQWELSSLNEDKETYVHAYGRWNGPAAAIPTVENVYTNVLDGIKATLEKEEAS